MSWPQSMGPIMLSQTRHPSKQDGMYPQTRTGINTREHH